jgi:predicted enzyme related to lactoylglutathione lyase
VEIVLFLQGLNPFVTVWSYIYLLTNLTFKIKIMSQNPVVHFEMGYFDADRAKKFYETAFGWNMQQMGPEMGNYVLAGTSEVDENRMVKAPGTINGGLYQKSESPESHAPSVVIAVPDIQAAMKNVVAAGGKILGAMDEKGQQSMEPMMIPGVGLWIAVQDTEQNRVSMMQPMRGE